MKTTDTFNCRRFRTYFVSEGNALISRNGYNLLTLSMAGLATYILSKIACIVGGCTWNYNAIHSGLILMLILFILCISYGFHIYSYLTEQKKSDAALLTVSNFEKFLSISIYAIMIPITVVTIYLGIDFMISILDRNYGTSLILAGCTSRSEISDLVYLMENKGVSIEFMTNPLNYIDDLINMVLASILGSMVLRKKRFSKRIVFAIITSAFLSTIMTPFLVNLTGYDCIKPGNELFWKHLLIWDSLADGVAMIILLTCIFLRIRKEKTIPQGHFRNPPQ